MKEIENKKRKRGKEEKKKKIRKGPRETVRPGARRGPWPNKPFLNWYPSFLPFLTDRWVFFFLWTKITRKIMTNINSFPSSILFTPCLFRRLPAPTSSPHLPLHSPMDLDSTHP
jgi:hypothetical protein